MRHFIRGALALILSATTHSILAHHSFAALYDGEELVTIEGRIASVAVRNPHSFVHVLVTGVNGEQARWAIEWGSANELGRLNRDSLKPGDEVVVVGNPSRTAGNNQMKMVRIERPADGWLWEGTFR